eukprot:403341485
MGNTFANCMPCEDQSASRRALWSENGTFLYKNTNKELSYTDLPDVIRFNDLKLHKSFKHGSISKNQKGSINEQLNISYNLANQKQHESIESTSKSNRISFKSFESHSTCKCKDVFHRIISEDDDDSDKHSEGYDLNYDELIQDQILDQDSFFKLSLDRKYSQFPPQSDCSLTECSLSPCFSKHSKTDGSISMCGDDIPDYCNQCTECSNTLQKVIKQSQNTNQCMPHINRQLSSFFLQKTIQCREKSSSPCKDSQESSDSFPSPTFGGNTNMKNLAPQNSNHNNLQDHHHHHDHSGHQHFEVEEFNKKRCSMLKHIQADRQNRLFNNKEYSMSRRDIIKKTSVIVHKLIGQFMERVIVREDKTTEQQAEDQSCCHEVKQSSLLFNEKLYLKKRNRLGSSSNGFSIQKRMPMFVYHIEDTKEKRQDLEQTPNKKTIETFILKLINRMKLTNEVCLLALIFIERLIKKGGVQVLSFNWKPIVYTAILVAAKFWEDINLWNKDFSDSIDLYPLKSTNQLEGTFMTLCNYELYVSEELYDNYYEKIIKRSQKQNKSGKHTTAESDEY